MPRKPRTDIRLIFTMTNGDTITGDWATAPDDHYPEMIPEILADLMVSKGINDFMVGGVASAINTSHVMMLQIVTQEIR